MNGPIETLMSEHRLIERMLDALVGYTERLLDGKDVPRRDLDRFVGFLRNFADACHHGKEEDILFRAMVDSGMPSEGGPIAVMLHEHVQGRGFIANLLALADGEAPFTEDEKTGVAENVQGYVGLLRSHIMKEDEILYPMAERALPAEAWPRIEKRFAEFEENETGPGEHERLHAEADDLTSRYTL